MLLRLDLVVCKLWQFNFVIVHPSCVCIKFNVTSDLKLSLFCLPCIDVSISVKCKQLRATRSKATDVPGLSGTTGKLKVIISKPILLA